jgi:polyphosphate kinase
LFTAVDEITREVRKIFDYLAAERYPGRFDQLLVAPFNLRQKFTAMVDEEIENARAGKRAYIILKLNNLEDPAMIQKLREAADAGVEVKLIVRSICCLAPAGMEAISIVGRFLEHGRIYIFHNGGDERYFIGSADWMTRNLNRRIEAVVPILSAKIRKEIRAIIDIQLSDNVDARVLDPELKNEFKPAEGPPISSQTEIYRLLEQ